MGVITADNRAEVEQMARTWWIFLVTGIAWVVVSFVILAFKPVSVLTIAYMVGFVLIAGGVNEFLALRYARGWKWMHIALGVMFIIAGILALLEPFQTFGILALLIGWYLLFKGLFTIIASIVERHEISLWGLMLAAGILDMVIGVWAIGYLGRSSWLLILWLGIGALVRGITEIVMAFKVRGFQQHPPLAPA